MPRIFNPRFRPEIKDPRSGLTLIEVVLVIAIISILLGAISSTFVVGLRAWDVGILGGGVRKDSSYSLRVFSEELRQTIGITSAGRNSVTCQSDLNGDGIVETVTYSWSGTAGDNFTRVQGTNTAILARGVQNAQFQYYDSNNNLLTFPVTASAVRIVELTLRLQREHESVQYMTKIRPRGI